MYQITDITFNTGYSTLDINNTGAESIEYSILSIVGIESVFAGPGFLTILKRENSDWESISKEINTIFDKL